MSALHQVLLANVGGGGYQIPYSLRFRRSNNAAMTRTAGTPTNAKIATWSFWHKRGALGGEWVWGESTGGASTFFTFDSVAPDTIRIQVRGANLTSTPVFRDPSAWYHFVVAVDTTQATAADRIKVYANNQAVTMSGTITLNADITFNESGKSIKISNGAGWFATSADYIDGYLAEFNFIDGQALTPSSFGQTDATTGVWVPKKYSGTYGNNGFYLKFADASAATAAAIGKDSSGNGNNWTPSGISVTSGVTFDQMLDTPTLNYAVMNPLSKSSTPTPAQGNLFISMGAVYPANVLGSIGVSSGKFYFETSLSGTGGSANGYAVGVATGNWANLNADPGGDSTSYTHLIDSRAYFSNNAATTNNSTSFTAGDIIGIAIDADNLTITFYKNNVQVGSAQTLESGQTWFPMFKNSTIAATLEYTANFGQRAFSYTPPTGFKALNTANLPTPSIKKGSLYMDATLRTGTGATASVSSLGFQPDLVWIKSRSAATNHNLFDSTRGVQKGLGSNLQSGQYTDANSLTAFNSNGYSLGSDASSRGVNINTNTYVDWAWKEGATPGFDVVTFAGTGAAQAVNHGLGVAPEFMILRVYDDTLARTWACWHKNLTSAAYYLPLEGIAAEAVDTTMFNSTAPTSTQFTAGSYNSVSTKNSVAYLWASVAGFSMIGSWTGNASTDGPFVWCGFRPRFLLLRNKSVASYWIMLDSVRNTANVVTDELIANTANAENGLAITSDIDFLASGFKIRSADANLNQSGNTIIFAAFAENPFKYARAR